MSCKGVYPGDNLAIDFDRLADCFDMVAPVLSLGGVVLLVVEAPPGDMHRK